MANGVFNIAKGKIAYYGGLPASSDALIAIPFSVIESDATIKDYDTLAAILGGSNTEQTTMGRTTLSSVTVTVDDSGDKVDIDCADFSYTGANAAGSATVKMIICYDPDTGTGTDSTLVPISYHDFAVTPDSNDINVTVASGGFASAGE